MENTSDSQSNPQSRTAILGTEKISKLLIMFSVPSIVSMVVNSIYNMVDQIFIGRGVGYIGNSATNVIFPMTVIAMAFALLIGDGTASFMSIRLGQGKPEQAAKGVMAGMIAAGISGIIMCALFSIFLEPLSRMLGATDEILPYALDYGRIIILGIPFFSICCAFSSMIRADGNPRYSMVGLLTGCVINLIGDPLFIFVFHWGVKGAAFATILGQFVNFIFCVVYIKKFRSVKLGKAAFKGCGKVSFKIFSLGISSFVTQMAIVAVIAVQNNMLVNYGALSDYGSEIPIAALGVTMKVFMVLNSIVIGLTVGAQPIFGYNYGSGRIDRVKKTYLTVIAISTGVLAISFLWFQLAPMSIVSIFGSESEVYNEFAIKCLRIYLMLIFLNGVQMVSGIFFQAIGQPLKATTLSLARQIVFMIPASIILCSRIGVMGALWAGPTADLLAFILSMTLVLISWRKL